MIEEFENKNGIPHNWINFAISRNADGHWQRLERGEIKLDDEFFRGFSEDLSRETTWKEYHSQFKTKNRLKDLANPSQLGDPVSLKAEAADSTPTDKDRGAASVSQSAGQPEKARASKVVKDTTIGDPVSLEAEEVVVSSQDQDQETSVASLQGESSSDTQRTGTGDSPGPHSSQTTTTPRPSLPSELPPIPTIDVSSLFWSMMAHSRHPDPYIFPALERLSSLPHKPIIGALSNTITFPPSHPYHTPALDLHKHFSVFISSSEVGIRKPERRIYELAIERLDAFKREHGGDGGGSQEGIKPNDVLFLDDIGENLKTARECGMRTLKVVQGKTWRAVKELERVTGLELMDEKVRRAKL